MAHPIDADLDAWLAKYGRTHSTNELVRHLSDLITRIEEEADAEAEEADDRRRSNPLEPDFRRL